MGHAAKIPILILCDEIRQAMAGTEQHISFLLWNLPRERFEIHFALLRNGKRLPTDFSPLEPDILDLHSFKNPFETFRCVLNLRRLVCQRSIKILHAFFNDSEFLSAIAGLQSIGCSRIVSRRNMGYDNTARLSCRNWLSAKVKAIYAVNAEAIKRQMISSENISSNCITVIYNPINRDRLEQGMSASIERNRWGLSNRDLVVGIVANIRPVKDYETFFKAAILVAEKVDNVKFIIVGSRDEGYWERIKILAENAELKKKLVFTGPIDNPIPVIRTLDVGVLSSTSEGLSNALIEYGAVGIPAVATDVGGNPEIVENGNTGYLVPPRSPEILASKITELLLNPEKRKVLGRKARELAFYRFDQEKILKQYEDFYMALVR